MKTVTSWSFRFEMHSKCLATTHQFPALPLESFHTTTITTTTAATTTTTTTTATTATTTRASLRQVHQFLTRQPFHESLYPTTTAEKQDQEMASWWAISTGSSLACLTSTSDCFALALLDCPSCLAAPHQLAMHH